MLNRILFAGLCSLIVTLTACGDGAAVSDNQGGDNNSGDRDGQVANALDQNGDDGDAGKSNSQSNAKTNATSNAAVSDVKSTLPEGDSWPAFRGPGGQGLSGAKNLPTEWGHEKNLAWKTELPGAGTSTPVVWGDRIFVTSHTGYGVDRDNPGDMNDLTRHVLALSLKNGDILWKKQVETKLPESEYGNRMHWHGYASNSPAVDGERVYAWFGKSGVFAFDHAGKQLWHASVGDQHHGWGSGSSVVLYKDLVIVNAFVESGAMIALNKKTGDEVWRFGGLKESWNTPALVDVPGGETELVVGSMGKVEGVDPDDGKRLWTCDAINWYIVGSMVSHDGVVFCIAGSKYEAVAIRAGGRGDVSDTHLKWRANVGSNVSSPVHYNGHVYWAHESNGIAYCVNAATGDLVYKERLPQRPGYVYASPIIADGKLFYTTRDGKTYVLPAKPQFEVLAVNDLSDRSVFNASPVAVGKKLLIRSDGYLYCVSQE